MHLHNGLHHAVAIQSAFMKALGEDDAEFTGIERAGETLTPVIDLWSKEEWCWPRRERLCAGFGTAAQDAGNYSNVQLKNPTGSGLLIIVDRIGVRTANAGGYTLDETTTTIGAVVSNQSSVRDGRWGSSRVQGVITQGVTAAVTGIPVWFYQMAASSYLELPAGWILPPGSSIYVRGAAINLGVSASFYWREREALNGEL